jgi:hypothetical protein
MEQLSKWGIMQAALCDFLGATRLRIVSCADVMLSLMPGIAQTFNPRYLKKKRRGTNGVFFSTSSN